MRKIKICEILNIEIELLQSDELKLLIGDMELSFMELISNVEYSFENDAFYNKKMGEVIAYLNCIKTFKIINDEQCEEMYKILDKMDEMRLVSKKQY